MRSEISTAIHVSGAALLALLLTNCRGGGGATSLEDRLEKLPTLPPDIAATLDPKTNATKRPALPPAPVRDPSPKPAACCSIREEKSLTVRVPLTKCAPLRDLIMPSVQGLLMGSDTSGGQAGAGAPGGAAGTVGVKGSGVRVYRLNTVNHQAPLETIVCMASDGPWDATFIEERACGGYGPQDSLFVSGWGGLMSYSWSGGSSNHPTEIQLVSCRDISTLRFACGISSCPCDSTTCPADQPCPCSLPW